jgi:hypothetical protein
LAVSAKHPAAFTVIAVFAACGISELAESSQRSVGIRLIRRWVPASNTNTRGLLLIQLMVAAGSALLVFYALNPVWWGDPVERTGQVYKARKGILDGQVAAYGGYDDPLDQLGGFVRQAFTGAPQYYEDEAWGTYIADQIDRYEASPWRGVSLGETVPGAVILILLVAAGWWSMGHSKDGITPARWIIALWALIILATSALLTPLEWQRYYLMTYPILGLLAGAGLVWLFEPVAVTRPHRIRLDSL